MDQLLYNLLGLVGFSHPLHPILITMVVGPAIASFLFAFTAYFFKKPEFFRTSRQLTVIALIFWFPTVAVGILDWQHFYGGSTKMTQINIKMILAGVLFVVLLATILLSKAGEKQPLLPLIFTLAATVLVSVIGYYGGEIVFGGDAKAKTVAAPAGAAVTNAGGYKEISQAGYVFAWKIHDNVIDVKISYATNGWVGIGFGKTGTMEGSHIILGFFINGKTVIEDHFGYARDSHKPQVDLGFKDTLTNRLATFADDKTTLSFTMPLNTGNPRDPVLAAGESYKILMANGGDDADDVTTYHGHDGRIVVDVTL